MTPAAVIRHALPDALGKSLDGQVLNRAEAQRIYNPSPEIDSLAEHVIAICRDYRVPQDRARTVIADVIAVLKLNEAEGRCHLDVAGQLDSLAHQLHTDGLRTILGVKQIARRVRPALQTMAEARTTLVPNREYVAAVRAVDDLFCEVPADRLFTASVESQLGKQPYALLVELYESRSRDEGQVAA